LGVVGAATTRITDERSAGVPIRDHSCDHCTDLAQFNVPAKRFGIEGFLEKVWLSQAGQKGEVG
jgi:hypothetical protein